MIRLRADTPVAVTEWCECGKHPRSLFVHHLLMAWQIGRMKMRGDLR
jgi:hypothetical protein